jgi:two-component system, sensor histidine kinase and response regulator
VQLALETEILFELSLAIGDSPELQPMLRRVLSEMLRLLNGSGAAVIRVQELDTEARVEAEEVAVLPRNLHRHPGYARFRDEWSDLALYRALQERTIDRPLVMAVGAHTAYVFQLPGFGMLVLFRQQATLSDGFLRAFAPITRKLAQSARACLVEDALRQQSWRLELAARTAGIGVWQYDLASERLSWDAQMFRVFDVDPSRFGGTVADFMACLHPDDRPRIGDALARALMTAEQFEMEFRVVTRSGGERYVFGSGRIERDAEGQAVNVVGVNLDVTTRRQVEEEMRRARDLAEAANEAKSLFIANMSHELRTPMNGIIGMTELALETELTDTQREYLKVVRSSADGLLTILNDILDFSKIDAGELHLETIPFSLPITIAETLKAISVRAQRKQLELVLDMPADIPAYSLGDPGRIRQILVNLCDNAVKFTSAGEIVVRVRATPLADVDLLSLSVQDSGIGIAPEKLDQIFEAFRQVDASVTRQFGGTGLGLSITRQLTTLMGGRISVESQPGRGSTFHVELPLPRAEAPADAVVPPLQRWDGCRALVVDDHVLGRATIVRWLEHWGFHVDEANGGAEAITLVRSALTRGETYDVLLLDSVMPGMDGFALAAELEAERLAGRGRAIMLSSGGRKGDAARCRELGIAGFLTKPATPAELREVITRVFSGRRAPHRNAPLVTRHSIAEQRRTLRILLVEDNPVNQAVAEGMLARLGHTTVIAEDGEEALLRTASDRFDLIFMDMQMPRLDGVGATRAIRAREADGPRTPIVAMTANALEAEREACFAAGMDDHIAKPIRMASVEAILSRYLAR